MTTRIVTVVGASGTLGSQIVQALLERGAQVRAVVRATSDRTKLKSLGVTEFLVADLMDATSLQQALTAEPRAEAVVASAAGFSAHSARTKGDNSRTDTEGYRNLVDAARIAGIPRFILISILGCDNAPGVAHCSYKFAAEKYLAEKRQPYLALRAAAFLDRTQDVIAPKVRKGVFPDIAPGVAVEMIYTPDLAEYAARAALDLPASVLNQSVDVRCNVPATGSMVAAAFTRVLGRPVVAKPMIPSFIVPILRLVASFVPRLRDQVKLLMWIRNGGCVSHEDRQKQKDLFGELPTIEDSVTRYCRDRDLIRPTAS